MRKLAQLFRVIRNILWCCVWRTLAFPFAIVFYAVPKEIKNLFSEGINAIRRFIRVKQMRRNEDIRDRYYYRYHYDSQIVEYTEWYWEKFCDKIKYNWNLLSEDAPLPLVGLAWFFMWFNLSLSPFFDGTMIDVTVEIIEEGMYDFIFAPIRYIFYFLIYTQYFIVHRIGHPILEWSEYHCPVIYNIFGEGRMSEVSMVCIAVGFILIMLAYGYRKNFRDDNCLDDNIETLGDLIVGHPLSSI